MLLATACATLDGEVAADRAAAEREFMARAGPALGAPATALATWEAAAELTEAGRALLADGVTVDEAVALAFDCHPGLAAELERLGVARAQLRQAALPDNPVLSASWKFFTGPDEIELSLSQSFLSLLFLPQRRGVAAGESAVVKAEVVARLVHHAYEVRRAHARACHADQQLRLARAVEAAAGSHTELMGGLHEAGSVTDGPRTLAAIGATRAEDAEAAAQLERRIAFLQLGEVIGLPLTAPDWTVRPSATSSPAADAVLPADHALVEEALARSLALAAARGRIAAAAARAGLASPSAWLGDAEAGIAVKHETSGDWGVGPLAAIGLPLFDAGGNARGAAQAELRRAELVALGRARSLAAATQQAAARARSLATRARTARERDLPLHAELVRATVQQYNAMQIGAFDVLEARERELAAERRAARLDLAAELARLDLAELLAGGWPDEAGADAAADAMGAGEDDAAGDGGARGHD
jgi:outer membrane protein TolC